MPCSRELACEFLDLPLHDDEEPLNGAGDCAQEDTPPPPTITVRGCAVLLLDLARSSQPQIILYAECNSGSYNSTREE